MRAIVGTQVVASGEVTVLGLPAGSPPLRRRVGYVTQAPSVYGDLTVRENLRWCWTSPPWASTRSCGASCGPPSTP
jgi:ABC-type multidrug transport system ATPase subunit